MPQYPWFSLDPDSQGALLADVIMAQVRRDTLQDNVDPSRTFADQPPAGYGYPRGGYRSFLLSVQDEIEFLTGVSPYYDATFAEETYPGSVGNLIYATYRRITAMNGPPLSEFARPGQP